MTHDSTTTPGASGAPSAAGGPTARPTIGIVGAGRVGTALARALVAVGHEVRVATHRPAVENSLLVEVSAPGASAVDIPDAAACDLVVLALPLHRAATLDPATFAGRTVVDVMNYWPPVDGTIARLEEDPRSSSEVLAEHLPGATVVRALNHIGYHELEEDARPAGDPERRALAVASDDPAATARVAALVEALGFDAVDAGPLAAAAHLQQGTEIFDGRRHDAAEIRAILAEAGYAVAS
ncbi:NADPH-dependent F420 reductase [Georgenia sp. Z1344]|uniref:NADPH-dependent F420 reductase n=1 Tax=Georgenia sp. Z1344 TaxID=3416706 RepID=UPI003CEC5806